MRSLIRGQLDGLVSLASSSLQDISRLLNLYAVNEEANIAITLNGVAVYER
jgi:hypothetical protein